MTRGVRPTAEQAAKLSRYPQRVLARETELSKETAASAQRGEAVTRANLRALLEAATRLDAKASATT